MKFGWYFNDEMSPSDELVDKFADSKFGMDKWTSFSREIIQNSLDARDDETKPVEVIFDLNKTLSLDDIPGGTYTKYVLERCAKKATNKQTQQAYLKGIEILNKPNVYCLKVSDSNTKGVETGRDSAWGAFVFDEGKSIKQRPGSAGSHGVGKKVPFIISTCNTVFYATKNKYKIDENEHTDILSQGKTVLINWDDLDGKTKSQKGWFGKLNIDDPSPKNRILPLQNDEVKDIHPYFIRKDEYGTDVIMIGVNAYENEELIKKTIISSIFENFFVAIKEGILKVNVMGETFDREDLEKFLKWYKPTEALHNSMNDLLKIYSQDKVVLPVQVDGESLGEVWLYFEDSSELNRKYYTVVREHGMKIKEYRINRADKAFSALVVVMGEDLNKLLSKLENAAHDDFITYDDDMDLDKKAIKALEVVKNIVESYIIDNTRINDGEDQEIEGLSEILAIPGFSPKITKKDSKVRVKRNKVNKKNKNKRKPDPEPKPIPVPNPNPEPTPKPKNKKEKTEKQYEAFLLAPMLIETNDGYLLRTIVKNDIKDGEFRIKSINSDEKLDSSIADLIISANDGWKKYKIQNGCISKVKLNKDQVCEITIKTSRYIRYRLTAELWYKE